MSETTFLNIGNAEIEKIRRLCQSTLNWTDGGYWMGNGPEPNCSLSQEQIKTSKISIKWPNQDSVDRWNKNWSKAQRRIGYLGTAIISTLLWEVQLTRTAFLAVVGGHQTTCPPYRPCVRASLWGAICDGGRWHGAGLRCANPGYGLRPFLPT